MGVHNLHLDPFVPTSGRGTYMAVEPVTLRIEAERDAMSDDDYRALLQRIITSEQENQS